MLSSCSTNRAAFLAHTYFLKEEEAQEDRSSWDPQDTSESLGTGQAAVSLVVAPNACLKLNPGELLRSDTGAGSVVLERI